MFESSNHLLRTTLLLGTSVLMVLSPLSATASRRHHAHYYHHRRISRVIHHKHARRTWSNKRKAHARWRHHKLYYVIYDAQKAKHRKAYHKHTRRLIHKHTSHRSHIHRHKFHTNYAFINNVYGYNLNRHSNYISPRLARLINNTWTPSNNVINQMENELNVRTLNDINNDRTSNGLSPVSDSESLNDLATMRSQQIKTNFNHYNSQGQRFTYVDGRVLGMNPTDAYDIGENIASGSLGKNRESGDPTHYYNTNADQIADMEDNSMVNYDQVCGNGHRENTLSPVAVSVGIANSYNPTNQSFYLAEEYSDKAMN